MNQFPVVIINIVFTCTAVDRENLLQAGQIIVFLVNCQLIAGIKTDNMAD